MPTLAGDEAGVVAAVDLLELVQHPEHVLAGGHHVGRRDVGDRAHVLRELAHPAAADLLLLALAEVVGVADHAALPPAERNVHDRALPGHPGRESLDLVEVRVLMVADATLGRTTCRAVLDPIAFEHLQASVIHPDRQVYDQRSLNLPQDVAGLGVEGESVGRDVELALGDAVWAFLCHGEFAGDERHVTQLLLVAARR
jgi:hypothetical protein